MAFKIDKRDVYFLILQANINSHLIHSARTASKGVYVEKGSFFFTIAQVSIITKIALSLVELIDTQMENNVAI